MSHSCLSTSAAGGFAPIKYFQLKYSSVTHIPQRLTRQRVYLSGAAIAPVQDLLRVLPQADFIPGSKTFRSETGQKCLLQQMSLDGAALHLFQNHHFSSVRSQCPAPGSVAQHHPAASPRWCYPHPNRPPVGKHIPSGALSLAWELVPDVQKRVETRHKPKTCWTIAPGGRDEASWSLAPQPTFQQGQPALAGDGWLC